MKSAILCSVAPTRRFCNWRYVLISSWQDLIIFPDDIEYKNVAQCTTGRVFVLKFKLSNRKFFFWMQEPKDEKDEDHCKKVNEYLNNPPAPGSAGGGSSLSGLSHGLSSLGDQLGKTLFVFLEI